MKTKTIKGALKEGLKKYGTPQKIKIDGGKVYDINILKQ